MRNFLVAVSVVSAVACGSVSAHDANAVPDAGYSMDELCPGSASEILGALGSPCLIERWTTYNVWNYCEPGTHCANVRKYYIRTSDNQCWATEILEEETPTACLFPTSED